MFRNIANRFGWIMLVGWMLSACSSNTNHQSKDNTPVTTDCQGSLKKQDDSAFKTWVAFNRKNDSVGSRKTFELIEILADSGCAIAQYLVGSELVRDDPKNAMGFLVSSSAKGNAAAQFELSKLYYEGYWEGDKRVIRDSNIADSYLSKSVDQGYPPALVDLAHKKIKQSFLLCQQAADSGSLDGANCVAQAYKYGIGVEDELWVMYWREYLFNSIAARLAAPAGQCHDFLERAEKYETGKPPQKIASLRQSVDQWFDNHPKAKNKLEDGGKCP